MGATDDELKLFLLTARRLGLDPFARQIHFIKRKRKNPQTGQYEEYGQTLVGIDGLRALAERTGKLAGIKRGVIRDEKGQVVAAWAEVYRTDWKEPVREEVLFEEYCQRGADGKPSNLWATMPAQQLKKCAEAIALRIAFPQDLSGVYVPEEMEQAYEPEPEEPYQVKTIPAKAWSMFWAKVKGEWGLTEERVREMASQFYGQELQSLTEAVKTREDMENLLRYIQTRIRAERARMEIEKSSP